MPRGRKESSARKGGKATKNPREYRALRRKGMSKARAAPGGKKTLKHLPARTRTALGKQANEVKRRKARRRS